MQELKNPASADEWRVEGARRGGKCLPCHDSFEHKLGPNSTGVPGTMAVCNGMRVVLHSPPMTGARFRVVTNAEMDP